MSLSPSVYDVSYITQHGVRELNEDTLLADEIHELFDVFDGMSSLIPYKSPEGKTGALIAAETAREAFLANPDGDLLTVAVQANKQIEAQHEQRGVDISQNAGRFSCTAAVIRIAHDTTQLLQIGDSVIIVEHADGSVTLPLGYHDHDLEIMRKWRSLTDQGITTLRTMLNDDILALRDDTNKTYGALNGDVAAEKMMTTTSLPTSEIRSILIITDGLFIPKSDPDGLDPWNEYIRICHEQGIQGLLDTVRAKENEDPELTRYPRYKKHDDATGIFITFTK